MNKLKFLGALGAAACLAACAGTNTTGMATDTRKAGYDAISAYNAVSPLAVAYEQSSYATPENVAQIKADSAKATALITTLGADLQASNPISAIELSGALAAVAALQTDLTQGATK